MLPELHQQVRLVFDEVVELPEGDRLARLTEICGPNKEIFHAVERLLRAHRESSLFLQRASPEGRRFGRYIISRELGRGAMGIVYEGTDPLIGRAVAVKIIHLPAFGQVEDAAFLTDRLLREARSAGRLSHPGIVTIYDVGQEGGVAFVAMERVKGPSLQQALDSGHFAIDWGKAIDILRQVAVALDYAHRNGVIHRDIKPGNILLHETGELKITDFGIAKIESGPGETAGTRGVLGTPSHMSPEQIKGETLDGRSDQFSLNVVAFHLLTGREPFAADSAATAIHKILYETRPSARALNPALPSAVDQVLERGLARLPDLRFASCAEFVTAIETAGYAPEPVSDCGSVEPLRGTLAGLTEEHRSPFRVIGPALALSAVGFVAMNSFGVFSPREPTHEPSKAEAVTTGPDSDRQHITANQRVPGPGNSDDKGRARQLYEKAKAYRDSGRQDQIVELFQQAADLGSVPAMVELGGIYMNDNGPAVANYQEARKWLLKAAYAGDSAAMVELGGMCLLGNGGPADPSGAVGWYEKAAAKGNASAMYDLGTLYERGIGVTQDRMKARDYYRQAAALGHKDAGKRLVGLTH